MLLCLPRGGGVPLSCPNGGYPLLTWPGYPLPVSWMGYPPISWMGYSSISQMEVSLPLSAGWGTLPHRLDGGTPPSAGWGYPPRLDAGTPSPTRCERTDAFGMQAVISIFVHYQIPRDGVLQYTVSSLHIPDSHRIIPRPGTQLGIFFRKWSKHTRLHPQSKTSTFHWYVWTVLRKLFNID